MAMQTGIGLSRIIILAGAGYTGTVLFNNGRLSDVFAQLQSLVKGLERKGESSDGDADAIASQVKGIWLSGNITRMVVPAAALGALGYAYMWWKGLSFSDLMWVTKRNMANAVSNLTKCLDQVNGVLASAQKYLTQRFEKVEGKLDDQLETSKSIKNEVTEVHEVVYQIGDDLDSLRRIVSGLYGTVCSLEDKQDQTIAGIQFLCHFTEGKRMKMPKIIQGLKEFEVSILSENGTTSMTDDTMLKKHHSFSGHGEDTKQELRTIIYEGYE